MTTSWIIREKTTKKVLFETFNPKWLKALNTTKYEAVPIKDYLASLNAQSGIVPQVAGRSETANAGQNRAGCQTCGEEDISPNVEAFEETGEVMCDDCFEAWCEDNPNELTRPNGQFGVGA